MTKALPPCTDTAEFAQELERAHGRLMFDVGANNGGTARMFAQAFERVVAFEPCLESFCALEADLPDNATALPIAMSDHVGSLTLNIASHAFEYGQLVTGSGGPDWGEVTGTRDVLCSTIDTEAAGLGIPDAIKVDTEGHEVEVLQGAQHTLRGFPTLYLEIHNRANLTPILHLLPRGYAVHIIRHQFYPAESNRWHDHFYAVAKKAKRVVHDDD